MIRVIDKVPGAAPLTLTRVEVGGDRDGDKLREIRIDLVALQVPHPFDAGKNIELSAKNLVIEEPSEAIGKLVERLLARLPLPR